MTTDLAPASIDFDSALPLDFDAVATLHALASSPVPLRVVEDEDAGLVRRFLYLRSLSAAIDAELSTLKDRVCRLVLNEDGERADVAGNAFSITWRHSYVYPQDVKDAEAEFKRLKKYHEHDGTRATSSAVLVVKAPRP